ncbi:MAG: M6 family metalloprotease domain-containing protein [Paludibacteraceae bacterium]|nr:M6 family metalloprotease domain-containing protein [Paludibacteraceae bacterium]
MRKSIVTIFLCYLALYITAKPAYRGPITRIAADGSEQTVYLHGNEHFHYMTDADGQWLDEATLLPLSEEMKSEKLKQKAETAAIRRAPQQTGAIGDQPNPAPRGLLILVNFADLGFTTPVATIDSMLNGQNFSRSYTFMQDGRRRRITSSGSARKYFQDQSYGQYNPVFDVVGPVTLKNNASYYGENNAQGNDKRAGQMINEACQLADTEFDVDFTLYDNDGDGYVDFVYIIYAGYGEADGGGDSTIWPHQSYTYYQVDNKYVSRYACGNELNNFSKKYDGIGTFCHEFSHVLGLPDLYIVGDGTHKTLGQWDIMDYGPYNNDGNTPPAYSAYERFYMGWLTPRALTAAETVELSPINENGGESLILSSRAHNLVGWNPNPTEFYLLEVRKKEGWDAYIPGSGMLISRIRYSRSKWQNNSVNATAGSMGVDILEADGSAPAYSDDPETYDAGYFGKAGDAFPAGATEWTAFAGHEITNIQLLSNGTVLFDYLGGSPQSVEQTTTGTSAIRILRNGKVLIIRNGITYDLNGRIIAL